MNTPRLIGFLVSAVIGAAAILAVRGVRAKADEPRPAAAAPAGEPAAGQAEKVAPSRTGDAMAGQDTVKKDTGKTGTAVEARSDKKPSITIDPVVLADGTIDLQNANCPVMGGKAQKDVTKDFDGVRVHFCCPGCDSTFEKDPKKHFAKLGIDDVDAFKAGLEKGKKSAAPVDTQAADEPKPTIRIDPVVLADGTIDLQNDKCPVMGGKAQKDVTKDVDGVRVHFCCPGCDSTFEKDPKKHFAKLGIDDLDAFKARIKKEKGAK